MPESPGAEKHDKEKDRRDSKKVKGVHAVKWWDSFIQGGIREIKHDQKWLKVATNHHMPNINSSSKWLTCMTPLTKSGRDSWVKAQSTTTSLFGQRPQQPHLPSLPYKTIAYQFHSSKTSWRSACWDEWWITPSCLVSPPQPWSPQPAWTPLSTRRPGASWRSSWPAVPPFRPSRIRDTLKVPKKQQQHSKCFRFHFFCGKLKRCYKQQRFGNVTDRWQQ